MKKAKYEIWINGHYLETFKSFESAEARVRTYERLDRYEREIQRVTQTLSLHMRSR